MFAGARATKISLLLSTPTLKCGQSFKYNKAGRSEWPIKVVFENK